MRVSRTAKGQISTRSKIGRFTPVLWLVAFLGCASELTGEGDAGGMDGGTSDGGTATVRYTTHVQPILQARCAPCHTTEGMSGHNVASSYADVHRPVAYLTFSICWDDFASETGPKPIGECAYLLAREGFMPLGQSCDGPMPMAGCVTQPELEIMRMWVEAGMPE